MNTQGNVEHSKPRCYQKVLYLICLLNMLEGVQFLDFQVLCILILIFIHILVQHSVMFSFFLSDSSQDHLLAFHVICFAIFGLSFPGFLSIFTLISFLHECFFFFVRPQIHSTYSVFGKQSTPSSKQSSVIHLFVTNTVHDSAPHDVTLSVQFVFVSVFCRLIYIN